MFFTKSAKELDTSFAKKGISLEQRHRFLQRIDVNKWRSAHQNAIDTIRPRREDLMDVYDNAMLDTHLQTVINIRTLSILNTPFRTLDEKGELNEELQELLDKRWMYDLIRYIMEAIYYGYSIVEFMPLKGGIIGQVNFLDRAHGIPEYGSVLEDVNSDDMFQLTEAPYNDYYLFITDNSKDNLGLLLECSRFTIFKKQSVNFYSLYQEVFGFPYRVAKTDSRDEKVRRELFKNLEEMGEAMYAILPTDSQFEIHESSKSDGQKVFVEGVGIANDELSKRVIGQTMTTDNGSSKSQGEVHERTADKIYKADIRYVQFIMNDLVFPLLAKHGYKVEGSRFIFDTSKTLKLADTQLQIDQWISSKHTIDPEYIQETYGTRILLDAPKEEKTKEEGKEAEPEEEQEEGKPKESNIGKQVTALYHEIACCSDTHEIHASEDPDITKLFLKVAQTLYDKGLKSIFSTEEWKKLIEGVGGYLYAGVEKGFGRKLIDLDYDTPDYNMLKKFKDNIYMFSAFKQGALCEEINALLMLDGKLREWSDFKDQVLQVHDKYNVNWLKTEYNASVAQSQMGAKWLEAVENKADFYLRFSTVGDSSVRDDHKRLEGITLPVDHKFWNRHYPPLGWGCRCDVELVPKSTNTETPENRIRYPDNVHPFFRKNVGKEQVIFDKDHPYFEANVPKSGQPSKKKKDE